MADDFASGHVGGDIVAWLEGRLDAARREAFLAHIKTCPDCAADFEWSRQVREAVVGQPSSHVPPEILVQLAARDEPDPTEGGTPAS
jgi:anti-sigma factor RsiW